MPELYQIIGAVLRDVAQARFMSDRYSRQISYRYEEDSLLRRFPVPRVEIEEVEFDLHFAVQSVEADPTRRTSLHTSIASLFDAYSVSITRAGLAAIREAVRRRTAVTKDKAELDAAEQLESAVLSEDNRDMLRGRLLRFFNENAEALLDKTTGALNVPMVKTRIAEFAAALEQEKEIASASRVIVLGEGGWAAAFADAAARMNSEIDSLAADVQAVRGKYPDYKIMVEVSPEALRAHPAISHVRVKSAVKNYRWAKVDVDAADMRNIRTLNPE